MSAEPEHGWHDGPRDRRKAAPEPDTTDADRHVTAKTAPFEPPPKPVDLRTWPCELCSHGHYPGARCGVNGCDCRG